ncbi:lipopolysaccharide biosynthesis protein [Consotaella salsifontis]|uniref:Membrane protein involved in the export of O-antigen and teichoic acid n=1 Tax=Consotaella salsifontis TaxID=1365950 RepID=A0A1T4Q3G6_9HYPH|nr:transporter [Consotaella salsifontis]SJZ98067.1 Membrane protein involved in the export of O-antigen and teichoic acid [Consotaella salsifontis]
MSRWTTKLNKHISLMVAYASLLGGSAGRLVLSLAYFVSVANSLTVADFGLFATASATGVVVSRIAAFGFVSPLYRTATVRKRLIGAYTTGFLIAFLLSLPLMALAAGGFYLAFFKAEMPFVAFCAVAAAEILCWRMLEVVVIVNNGLGRFTRGAVIVIMGSGFRAIAAVSFAIGASHTLTNWSLAYLGANALSLLVAAVFFYPRQRLRFTPHLYFARWRDSVSVAGAEILFYLQSELDKMLVLSLGGAEVAGIYAMLMRLIDLTAMPVRAFNTMIVQKLMRSAEWLASWRTRILIEGGVALVSIAGLGFLGLVLHVAPRLLGNNVAEAAPLVLLPLLVPAFRNLVEYESELLYATGRTTVRALILALVGLLKAGLLALLLTTHDTTTAWIVWLNGVFFVLWLSSALTTYAALDAQRRRGRATALTPSPQPGE